VRWGRWRFGFLIRTQTPRYEEAQEGKSKMRRRSRMGGRKRRIYDSHHHHLETYDLLIR
jgi:hypothetical protein